MSLILRHNPEAGNITLDAEGWAKVSEVLNALRRKYGTISRTELNELVATNDKQRFAFNAHGDKIRASQGHSVEVDLALPETEPPLELYHGTKNKFIGSIFHEGLKRGTRQHVHLSKDVATAIIVGNRRAGESIILVVDTTKVSSPFYLSANGVWLADAVPPEALTIFQGLEENE